VFFCSALSVVALALACSTILTVGAFESACKLDLELLFEVSNFRI
jgi:hypothetical protein